MSQSRYTPNLIIPARQFSRPANTVVALGDSITAKIYNSANPKIYGSDSYFNWANVLLSRRMVLLKNAGVSGQKTDQILARVESDVIANNPAWCIVEGGINDVLGSIPAVTIQANLQSIYQKLYAAGIRVVATTVTPDNSLTTAQKNILNAVNHWIRNYCQNNPGIILCDWAPMVTTDTGVWGTGLSGSLTADGTHPTIEGGQRLGEVLANTLSPHMPFVDILPSSNYEPDNLCTNAMFSGDQGNGLATNWSVLNGGTYTLSKVARTDGKQGYWQQIAQTVDGASALQIKNMNTDSTKWATGDKFYGELEFQIDSGFSGYFFIMAFEEGGSGNTVYDVWTNTGTYPYYPRAGVLKTPLCTVSTGVRLALSFIMKGTGTVRIGRARLAKPTTIYA